LGCGPDADPAAALLLKKSEGKFVYTAEVADEIESLFDECDDRAGFMTGFCG